MTTWEELSAPASLSRKATARFSLLLFFLFIQAAGAEPATVIEEPIPNSIWEDMQGKSWHPNRGCPNRDELVLLTVPYLDFQNQEKTGQMIVVKSVSRAVTAAFQEIFDSREFRIERMELVDKYGGNDDELMRANNTSAFNCRYVGGTHTLSSHGRGWAVDINPIQNPWVKGNNVAPPEGAEYAKPNDRKADIPGLIVADSVVTRAFAAQDWKWGGDWTTKKDYQHFSKDGN